MLPSNLARVLAKGTVMSCFCFFAFVFVFLNWNLQFRQTTLYGTRLKSKKCWTFLGLVLPFKISYILPKLGLKICLVVLHNFFLIRCGQADIFFSFKIFFFPNQSQSYTNIASISPNKGANKSTLPKKSLHTSFKPVLKCKQVNHNNFNNNFKRSKFSMKKKPFLEFWKLGAVYFCTVKTFFQFSKIRGGRWRTTKQLFWGGPNHQIITLSRRHEGKEKAKFVCLFVCLENLEVDFPNR